MIIRLPDVFALTVLESLSVCQDFSNPLLLFSGGLCKWSSNQSKAAYQSKDEWKTEKIW